MGWAQTVARSTPRLIHPRLGRSQLDLGLARRMERPGGHHEPRPPPMDGYEHGIDTTIFSERPEARHAFCQVQVTFLRRQWGGLRQSLFARSLSLILQCVSSLHAPESPQVGRIAFPIAGRARGPCRPNMAAVSSKTAEHGDGEFHHVCEESCLVGLARPGRS